MINAFGFIHTLYCRLALVVFFAAGGCALAGSARAAAAEPAMAALDLSHYKMTFREDFKTLDISNYGPGTRWIAHTPWNGDFGNNRFGNPATDHNFQLTATGMKIIARQDDRGKWVAGLICSRNSIKPDATGFAQQYGYFEMRAKLPDGPGVWPAFWLIGTDRSFGTAEIDVMEYYGKFRNSFRTTQHFWSNGTNPLYPKGMKLGAKLQMVPPGLLTRQFNDFGVLITPATITYYLNRAPYWETPTPDVYRQPMYVLADLAVGGGWPFKDLHGPVAMDIAYIHVYVPNSQ
jgi:beta-glucanase (GH16 family)